MAAFQKFNLFSQQRHVLTKLGEKKNTLVHLGELICQRDSSSERCNFYLINNFLKYIFKVNYKHLL